MEAPILWVQARSDRGNGAWAHRVRRWCKGQCTV